MKYHFDDLFFFSFKVWIAAASQVTFSLSVGFGSILGYASFNKFKANYLRFDINIIMNIKTVFFSGTVLLSLLVIVLLR